MDEERWEAEGECVRTWYDLEPLLALAVALWLIAAAVAIVVWG